MKSKTDILHEAKRLRLLAAALELQHYASTAANVVPIPGGDQVIAIGTPAHIALALELGPVPAELLRLGATMANTLCNLKQAAGKVLEARTAELLGELQQKWDEARRDYREAAQQHLADQSQQLAAGAMDSADARDAAMFRWQEQNRTWRTRYRIKPGRNLEWQMLDDGEPWGQWGDLRKVIDAAMRAIQQEGE